MNSEGGVKKFGKFVYVDCECPLTEGDGGVKNHQIHAYVIHGRPINGQCPVFTQSLQWSGGIPSLPLSQHFFSVSILNKRL